MNPVRRILIIDDSEVVLARMKRALLHAGYEIITSTQIVGNARHLPSCDLVIIDFHMPGMDGSMVVKSMRSVAHSSNRTCPFYVYTSDANVALDYKALGFDGAFTSKGNDTELVRQVGAYFRLLATRAARERTDRSQ